MADDISIQTKQPDFDVLSPKGKQNDDAYNSCKSEGN
jgi:hypothetical protein